MMAAENLQGFSIKTKSSSSQSAVGGRVTRTWRSKHVRGLLSLLPLGSPVLKLEADVNYAEGKVDAAEVNWITKFEKKARD